MDAARKHLAQKMAVSHGIGFSAKITMEGKTLVAASASIRLLTRPEKLTAYFRYDRILEADGGEKVTILETTAVVLAITGLAFQIGKNKGWCEGYDAGYRHGIVMGKVDELRIRAEARKGGVSGRSS